MFIVAQNYFPDRNSHRPFKKEETKSASWETASISKPEKSSDNEYSFRF